MVSEGARDLSRLNWVERKIFQEFLHTSSDLFCFTFSKIQVILCCIKHQKMGNDAKSEEEKKLGEGVCNDI